jgi:hypothetical protein
MVMESLDRMMSEAAKTPEEAQQLADLEGDGGVNLKPTGIQLNHETEPVTIYHTVTGEPRSMPRLYARTALLKRFRAKDGEGLAGKLVFKNQPTVPWILGDVKCFLHPSRPQRSQYTAWGLPVCRSEHFPSEFEAEQHMNNDHNASWSRIAEIKDRAQEEEDRKLQRQAIENQTKLLEQLSGNSAQKTESKPIVTRACDCGEVIEGKGKGILTIKYNRHRKTHAS